MAFEVPKTGYQQIDPTFNPGYPYPEKYHNVGQLQTPYQGKSMGKLGDYGPVQSTVYYTPNNPNYPYVMDKDFRAVQYMPGRACSFNHPGYSPVYQSEYPEKFVPPNYFSPRLQHPSGQVTTDRAVGYRLYDAMVRAYKPEEYETEDSRKYKHIDDPISYSQGGTFSLVGTNTQTPSREDYVKLRVAHKEMSGGKNFYPFN